VSVGVFACVCVCLVGVLPSACVLLSACVCVCVLPVGHGGEPRGYRTGPIIFVCFKYFCRGLLGKKACVYDGMALCTAMSSVAELWQKQDIQHVHLKETRKQQHFFRLACLIVCLKHQKQIQHTGYTQYTYLRGWESHKNNRSKQSKGIKG
jgi:hypothetical protein